MFYGALASSAAALPARMIELQYHDNTEADNIGNPASEVDIVQHLEPFKAGKYISRKQVRLVASGSL